MRLAVEDFKVSCAVQRIKCFISFKQADPKIVELDDFEFGSCAHISGEPSPGMLSFLVEEIEWQEGFENDILAAY